MRFFCKGTTETSKRAYNIIKGTSNLFFFFSQVRLLSSANENCFGLYIWWAEAEKLDSSSYTHLVLVCVKTSADTARRNIKP